MATSVIPAVIDALVSRAKTAMPTTTVYDGVGVSDEPGDFLMIGVDDPDRSDQTSAAASQQEWAHANNTARDEMGDIACVALSWNGSGDQKTARDAAHAITGAVETFLRADPSLGNVVLWSSYGTTTTLSQNQSDSGALALVSFQVHFRARI